MSDYEVCIDCAKIYEDVFVSPWCSDCTPKTESEELLVA